MLSPFALDASLVLGALLIVAVAWAYLRHRALGWAGLALVLFGFLLVGGSAYGRIGVSAGEQELAARLEQFERALRGVEERSAAVATGVAELKARDAELREEIRLAREEIARRPASDLVERVKELADLLDGMRKRTDAIDHWLGKLLDPRTGLEARMRDLLNAQTKELADKLLGSIIRPR